jgi:beta-phosphoglucomutase-like phosphatase (HAD superfamily)
VSFTLPISTAHQCQRSIVGILQGRLNTVPENCVVFEDTPAGIEAAFRAGMRCVAITTTLSATEIRALPNTSHVIAAVADFHDAAVIELIP